MWVIFKNDVDHIYSAATGIDYRATVSRHVKEARVLKWSLIPKPGHKQKDKQPEFSTRSVPMKLRLFVLICSLLAGMCLTGVAVAKKSYLNAE